MGIDFYEMFACVGLWNALFVIIYSVLDLSVLMKYCTRSTEEIFALFIFFAFSIDAIKECVDNFESYYCLNDYNNSSTYVPTNYSMINTISSTTGCAQQKSVLFLFLMLATVWLALTLYNFNKTPYLTGNQREIVADYALPISVIWFSFVGSYLFRDIKAEPFELNGDSFEFISPTFRTLTFEAIIIGMALGFALSLLFFMDQNISAALVNNPNNNLKKGNAYHWDLFIVGLLNGFLSIYGLPWMHGILPHSPIHARSLADIERKTVGGYVKEVVIRIRETRITGLLIHVLIGLSLNLIQYLNYIPVSVLSGLFLYCACGALRGNSFFERILFLISEKSAYPPDHYLRQCPQRTIHFFTFIQLIQLAVLCFFGFAPWPYVQMAFPIMIAVLIPIRPQPVYIPGEVVSGQCVIFLEGQMNLDQLTIKLVGLAECSWTESHQCTHRDADGKSHTRTEQRRIHSCHPCVDMKYNPGAVYSTLLNPGQHNIGFNFQLPSGVLPSSYEGTYGHIRYYLEAHIHKNQIFAFDERTTLAITLQSPPLASIQELSQPIQNSNNKTIGFFGGQTVSMRCQMQRTGHTIGTTIPISVFVDNKSKKSMTLKASLKQDVSFTAEGKHKYTSDKIVRAIGNTIQANCQQSEILPLLIPITSPVLHNICPIINIKYTVIVTLDIPGSFDLHCELPVILTNTQLPLI